MLIAKHLHCYLLVAILTPLLARASCWEEAGASYAIEPALLKAIAWKESHGHPHAIGPANPKTGHRAFGLMQIYSVHLPTLARYGITKEQLFDACTSEKVGAWVLADCIQRFGSTWKAVGCYNTGPESKNITAQVEYVKDVKTYYVGYKRQEQGAQSQTVAFKGD